MSVIVSKRKISEMQFYKSARDLRKNITRPNKDSRVRMGRKLKKFKKMDFNDDEILNAYKIWRGYWVSINGNPLHTDKLLGELL